MSATAPAKASRSAVDRWTAAHRTATDVLLALALAAMLGALTVSGAQGVHWSAGWIVLLVIAFVVLHATVVFRVRAPAFAFALAGLAMLAVALVPDARIANPQPDGPDRLTALFLPSCLVFLLLLYSAAAHLPARLARPALAVALIGAVLAAVRMSSMLDAVTAGGWLVPVYAGLGLAITVLAVWWLGRLSAARRAHAAAERQETARVAVLEERSRIAREMHDIVAHSLAVIVRQAEGGAYVAAARPDRAAESLQTIARAAREALTDMRGLLGVLRDPGSGGPADAAPQPALADVPALVERVRNTGTQVELAVSGDQFPVGPATELAAYRLVQEGLTNAIKHAGPRTRVAVSVCWRPTELAVAVLDDGADGESPAPVPSAGAGLQGLRDRVRAMGGTMSAEPCERGFRVRARFPRPEDAS